MAKRNKMPTKTVGSVLLWRVRAVLQKNGLLDQIDAYITQHEKDMPELYQAWNFGNSVTRNSQFVEAMQSQFSITDEQADAIFAEAAKSE